jgi:hypothetical protein
MAIFRLLSVIFICFISGRHEVSANAKKTRVELTHHIQDHCPLVDREMAETALPEFIENVFYRCKLGSVIEVFKGCSVPCANENWKPDPTPSTKSNPPSKSGN